MIDGASETTTLLEARVAAVPPALEEALRAPLPEAPSARPSSVVVTGIGSSEGPARMLAAALTDAGVAARFVSLAAFYVERQRAERLVVFSQGLSPNARLALGARHDFSARWLVTSRPDASALVPGVEAIVVPPAVEDRLLVRVIGPTVATLLALRLAALLANVPEGEESLMEAPRLYQANKPGRALPDGVPLVVLASGPSTETAFGHTWKLLEARLAGAVPLWDALQFAHGPRQALYESPAHFLALSTPRGERLLDRTERTLAPERHTLERLSAAQDGPLAYFEHAAQVDAILLATQRAFPRDLVNWPGRGTDSALYDLEGGEEPEAPLCYVALRP